MRHESELSRRDFVRASALAGAATVLAPVLAWQDRLQAARLPRTGSASRVLAFNHGWLFGGKVNATANAAHQFVPVTLPHCVAPLSWDNWDPASWQDLWLYRRQFTLPREFSDLRVFLKFDGVMVGATPTINGDELAQHLGGYLPFRYELTPWLKNDNTLDVVVDSRWSNAPPEGAPQGPKSVDFLAAGGIHRSVWLQAVPQIYIQDVFAKPVHVLESDRHIEVHCGIDAAKVPTAPVRLKTELREGDRVISRSEEQLKIDGPGISEITLTLANLGNVQLWHPDSPNLCDVVTTLLVDGKAVHDYRVRVGMREARFELDGFFLNGRRSQLFGLNRHEIFPYVGGAMPDRVMRHDAEILRREFHCNIVRCSHYPQTEAFLDACDELGLMVWEEVPGWWYIGDDAWKDLLVRDVKDMIVRDRNHPAVVIWGVRANETPNDPALYRRTTEAAKSLDDSRPASGTMTPWSRKNWQENWHEDVFAFDDYQANPDGSVRLEPPVEGYPYLITEAVGQFDYAKRKGFAIRYRRAGDIEVQQAQAIRHAQAHSRAAENPRICGLIAWCGFEYESLVNAYKTVKSPGVADIFRIPKLGASFYQAQGDASVRPVIQPNFYWDFGPHTPQGPGKHAAIFSNCDRLELYIAGKRYATLLPDTANFPHLKHAPFFVDLELDGTGRPELRIDGYVDDHLALSRSFSSDPSRDRLAASADDDELFADGSDATRLVFQVVDHYGANRAFATGEVRFGISGPAMIVGDNPFSLADSGGAGAIWIQSIENRTGSVHVTATHSALGSTAVDVRVVAG